MKIKYFHNLRFSVSKTRFDATWIGARAFVKDGLPMLPHLNKVIYALGGKVTPNWVRLCVLYLKKLNQLNKHGGIPMVVKYLKVASVIIQQVSGGHKLHCLNDLGIRISRSKSGLPRFIPADQRKLIMKGNKRVIKFWLTLISIFRDLHYFGELKLKTITSPSSASSDAYEIKSHIKSFTYLLWKDHDRLDSLKASAAFQMLTSGPQVDSKNKEFNSSPAVVHRSLKVILEPQHRVIHDSIKTIMSLTANLPLEKLWQDLVNVRKDQLIFPTGKSLHSYLGKLAIKAEAAGKVRVFAMVDPWTQWVLRPLHLNLFKVLSRLPMDGTFNQLNPLTRIPWGKVPLYSYDLSAATDRLPIWLQTSILSDIFGEEFGLAWQNLLVNREYLTPKWNPKAGFKRPKGILPKAIKYSVGQPMGALSSWAMLAITHHYVVQYSAWISGVVPKTKLFTQYAVLGDDIVIWNSRVSKVYLKMMKRLGVDINLAKSIVSPKGTALEFAKRTLIKGQDVSPIPFKEQSAAHRNVSNALSFQARHNIDTLHLLRFLGYGYKVDPTKPNSVVTTLKLALAIPKNYKDLLSIFSLERPYIDLNGHSYPLSMVRKTLLTIVRTELIRLKRATILSYELSAFSSGCYVSSIGPWRTPEAIITTAIIYKYIPGYLADLRWIGDGAKMHLNNLSDLFAWYDSFLGNLPDWAIVSDKYRLVPMPTGLLGALEFIFRASDELSRIHFDLLMKPKPTFSVDPTFVENARVLRLWNQWVKRLSKVKAKF